MPKNNTLSPAVFAMPPSFGAHMARLRVTKPPFLQKAFPDYTRPDIA